MFNLQTMSVCDENLVGMCEIKFCWGCFLRQNC